MPHRNNKIKKSVNLPAVGEVLDAEVFKITDFGAFVKLPGAMRGLIHISQIADSYVKNVSDHLKAGDKVKARVVQVTSDGKIDLTLKTLKAQEPSSYPKNKEFRVSIFEEKINEFLQEKAQNAL